MRYLITKVLQIEIDSDDIPDLSDEEDPKVAAIDLAFDIPSWEWDAIDWQVEELYK